tara:strand:- start:560 stop:754 length:195 start_codon:yes stop_codon:yes gene_type:complete
MVSRFYHYVSSLVENSTSQRNNKSCQSDSLFPGLCVPIATLAQIATPQNAAALGVMSHLDRGNE